MRGYSPHDEATLQKRLWTPLVLPGCVALYDFSCQGSIVWNGSGFITSVNDQTGINPALGTVNTIDTTWSANGIGQNGAIVRPSGAQISGLRAQSTSTFQNVGNPFAIVTLAVWTNPASSPDQIAIGTGLNRQGAVPALIASALTTGNLITCDSGSNRNYGPVLAANTPYLIVSMHGSSAPKHFYRLNGGATTAAAQDDGVTIVPDQYFNIGQINAGRGFVGSIAFALQYKGSLSDADAARIEGWAAHKWGLQNSILAANHPYRNKPPVLGQ